MSHDAPQQPPAERVTVVIAPDELSAEVTIQGRSQTVRGDGAKETRRSALDLAAGYATHIGQPIIIEARDAFSVWRLEASPGGVVRGLTETPPPSKPKRAKQGSRTGVLVAAGVLAVVLAAVVGVIVFQALPGGTVAQGEETAAPETVPFEARPAPAGFSTDAVWRLPIAPGTRPAVADDGTRAAFVGADERLAVVAPDGERVWAAELPLPIDDIEGPLRFVAGQDGLRVALVGPSTLWIWPTEGGEPEEYELPSGTQATFAGAEPLVTGDNGAFLTQGGELVPVEAPEGTGALLGSASEVLMASANGPWFWASAEGQAREIAPTAPEGAGDLDRVITASENYVVVRWEAADDEVVLALHDAADGSVAASTEIAAGDLADASWIEGTEVAAYGPVLIDLASGETRILPGFTPLSAAGAVLYGELDGGQVAVGGDAEPTEMDQDAARPWGLLDGHAVVLADDDLYALSPN